MEKEKTSTGIIIAVISMLIALATCIAIINIFKHGKKIDLDLLD